MKLILTEYLSSLRERDELDALMPTLLSELGFTVLSRPGRGTRQYGVDFAAVGPDDKGERSVFLFSIKAGNLDRAHWNDGDQALRPSLDEIQDVYIPRRIPVKLRDLKVVICICFGGRMLENVQDQIEGYAEKRTTDRLSFETWNGDKIAGLLLDGALREAVLPEELKASFRKAVAMVDEPDVSVRHFEDLVEALSKRAKASGKAAVTAARQAYIALWTLYVWGRTADNIEAPYQASELCVLTAWEFLKPYIGKTTQDAKAMTLAFKSIEHLHQTILLAYIGDKILPHVGKQHGLSLAVGTRSPLDVNLRMFEVLGRLSLLGLWRICAIQRSGKQATPQDLRFFKEIVEAGIKLIDNNPSLCLPIRDDQAVEIALFLHLWWQTYSDRRPGHDWIVEMVGRLDVTLALHGRYTCVLTNYADLAIHPAEKTKAYREEVTGGSTLIPMLAAYCVALGDGETLARLTRIHTRMLAHCNLQTWIPDEDSEAAIYVGGASHGVALSDLPLTDTGAELVEILWGEVMDGQAWSRLSAISTGYWPVLLLACRRHRLPVPPQVWIAGAAEALGLNEPKPGAGPSNEAE